MYNLDELLGGMRGVCLRGLEEAFDELREKKQRFFAEFAMQQGDVLVREGPLSLPFRCDALVVSEDGTQASPHFFDIGRRWHFSTTEFGHGGLSIELSSCHWEAVGVAITGDSGAVGLSVKKWFEAAFMTTEERGQTEVQNVVHDICGFRSENGVTTFVLDCGTMPIARMFGLFDILRESGATRVELSMP